MPKTKEVNYTPEMEATLKTEYAAGTTTKAIGELVGRSTRSVIAKLSRMEVYKKAERKTKTGEAIVTKAQLVKEIATKLGVEEEVVDSLASSNKEVLKLVAQAL